jgi:polar amino acid transport system substrate-binding protein
MYTASRGTPRLINRWLAGLVLMTAGFSAGQAKALDELHWITEEFAPYNYSENGVATGIAVDVLVKVWERLGMARTPADIQVLPWARGYRIAQEQVGTCLFAATVTEARRDLFVFIEPLIDSNVSIIAAKSRGLNVDSMEGLAPYRIGVVRDDIGDQALVENGFEGAVVRTDSARILMRMLQGARFDAISYNYVTARWAMAREAIDASLYESVLTLREGHMGYACHRETDPALIARLQGALDELLADGSVDAVIQRYLQ